MPATTATRQRQQLVANVLFHAAQNTAPAILAKLLDTPVRVYLPGTDYVHYVPLRMIRADHQRAE